MLQQEESRAYGHPKFCFITWIYNSLRNELFTKINTSKHPNQFLHVLILLEVLFLGDALCKQGRI